MQTEFPYIFCGWIYIQSAITTQVYCGDPYIGKSQLVTDRDKWVPFAQRHPTSEPEEAPSGRLSLFVGRSRLVGRCGFRSQLPWCRRSGQMPSTAGPLI